MIGENISHYRILEKLGEGGMGVIYLAEDIKLKRNVALKFLPHELSRDNEAKRRFIQEAQSASALQHTNICTIHEIDETNEGQLFIVMDCYEGESLKEKISRGPMNIEEVVDITVQIANGLLKAHKKRIVHRDIKPANIFITADRIAKIIDFGLAKLTGKTILTKEGSTLGTVNYMSPEQILGKNVDQRTDIWALGVLIYQMITGQQPFKGDYDQAVFYSVLNEEPEPVTGLRSGIPVELERIVNKTLKKNPDERYHSAEDLIVDLKNLVKEIVSGDYTHVVTEKRKKLLNKKVIIAILIIVIPLGFLLLRPLFTDEIPTIKPIPIAVISFENQTGEAVYDRLQKVIPNLLITSLEQSKYFQVTTWERMNDLLKQIGKSDVKTINKDIGFELCRMDGIDAIVLGSITKLGDVFVTDVKVLDVHTKEILKSAKSQGKGESSIIETQIDELSREVSKGVGLLDRRITPTQRPVTDVTTTSIDAYNYFLSGREEFATFNFIKAIEFFKKAISLDSSFALAYSELAKAYGSVSEEKLRNSAWEKAKQYSEKATEKERLFIEAGYASIIGKDLDKSIQILRRLTNRYPKDKFCRKELAEIYGTFPKNQWEKAVKEYKIVLELDPYDKTTWNDLGYNYYSLKEYENAISCFKRYAAVASHEANPYDSMGEIYFEMGEINEAIKSYVKALEMDPEFYTSEYALSYIYAYIENYTETKNYVNKIITKVNSPGLLAKGYFLKAFYSFWLGQYNQAIKELSISESLSKKAGHKFGKGCAEWLRGAIYREMGKLKLARKSVNIWYPLLTTYPVSANYDHGLIYLMEGKIDSAKYRLRSIKEYLPKIERGFKDCGEFNCRLFQGEIFLAENKPDSAIIACKQKSQIVSGYVGNLSSISGHILTNRLTVMKDVLARAYYQNGNIDQAIEEYEKLTTIDSSRYGRDLIHPGYYYRLAKLYEKTGKLNLALDKYRRFLELWKNADRDQPMLMDAKKRYAKLSGSLL